MGQDEYHILDGYLEAALWSSGEEFDGFSISDISEESRKKANDDVLQFIKNAHGLLDGIDPSQIGHDFWLTRNGHGAGFWDRGLGDIGDELTNIAKSMGEKYLYKGDNGKIYID